MINKKYSMIYNHLKAIKYRLLNSGTQPGCTIKQNLSAVQKFINLAFFLYRISLKNLSKQHIICFPKYLQNNEITAISDLKKISRKL